MAPCSAGIPLAKLNVNGGAIAIGHPFGVTGTS
jgi:acetyl-CoA C-acetyltransferase